MYASTVAAAVPMAPLVPRLIVAIGVFTVEPLFVIPPVPAVLPTTTLPAASTVNLLTPLACKAINLSLAVPLVLLTTRAAVVGVVLVLMLRLVAALVLVTLTVPVIPVFMPLLPIAMLVAVVLPRFKIAAESTVVLPAVVVKLLAPLPMRLKVPVCWIKLPVIVVVMPLRPIAMLVVLV